MKGKIHLIPFDNNIFNVHIIYFFPSKEKRQKKCKKLFPQVK